MPLTLRLAAAGGAAAAAPSCKRARSSAATRQCRGWHGGGLVVAKCVPFGTPQKRRADGLGAVPRRAVSAAAAARPPLDGVFFASAAAPNGGLFPELDRQFDEIDRQFAEMNRQMDRELADVFGRTDAMVQQQRERTQQLREGALREARERTPNVAIERYEDRGDGRYMYYESIQITSGGRIGMGTLPMASAAGGASPLLLLAAVVAGAYVAVAAAFARAYERTTYRDASKWALVAGWPFLALWSKRFREQLAVALQVWVLDVWKAKDGEET